MRLASVTFIAGWDNTKSTNAIVPVRFYCWGGAYATSSLLRYLTVSSYGEANKVDYNSDHVYFSAYDQLNFMLYFSDLSVLTSEFKYLSMNSGGGLRIELTYFVPQMADTPSSKPSSSSPSSYAPSSSMPSSKPSSSLPSSKPSSSEPSSSAPSSDMPSSKPSSSVPTSVPTSVPSQVPTSVPSSSVPSSTVPTSSVPSSTPTSSAPSSSVPTSSVPTSSVPTSSMPTLVPTVVPTTPTGQPTVAPTQSPTCAPENCGCQGLAYSKDWTINGGCCNPSDCICRGKLNQLNIVFKFFIIESFFV
jgi:hypothetical protein